MYWQSRSPSPSSEEVDDLNKRKTDRDDIDNCDIEERRQMQDSNSRKVVFPRRRKRREENSFSFTHFLQNDGSSNHHYTGTKPKVYTSHRTSPEPNVLDEESSVYSRNPTELPDFVQDHLVVEQCYMKNQEGPVTASDVDNLPDFTVHFKDEMRQDSHNKKYRKSLFDSYVKFIDCEKNNETEQGTPSLLDSAHLDLPNLEKNEEPVNSPESLGFPFDLQVNSKESNSETNCNEECTSNGISANVTKTLPDFLNDGPIRNRGQLATNRPDTNSIDSLESRLSVENERLRRELEIARRQASERLLRIEVLEAELASRGHNEEDNVMEDLVMEKIKEKLKQTTKRALNAEKDLRSLRREMYSLTDEIFMLRLENKELRMAVGCEDKNCKSTTHSRTIAVVANDLRTAASTAEASLRQLMSGVDNLRVFASALENMDKIEDRTKDFLPDFEEDNATGPAL